MGDIIYKYINYKDEKFKQVINLRYCILFEPFNKIEKYEYDELDEISMHLVALDKERVLGYSRMTNIKGTGKITNVVVSLECINRGIGLDMMKKHINKAKEANMSYVSLNARLDTVNFYKKVGFECEGDIFISDRSGLYLQKMHMNFS
jgi:predicted GNAT family N-acyltransferase